MQNFCEFVQVFNVVVRWVLTVLDFTYKTFRQFDFIGKVFLRYAECFAFFFHLGDDVLINL